jgi:hypothetical protein
MFHPTQQQILISATCPWKAQNVLVLDAPIVYYKCNIGGKECTWMCNNLW